MSATREHVDLKATMDAECPCEYGHYGAAPCTGAVTHRIAGCGPAFNACTSATATVIDRIHRADTCVDCQRPAGECWTIRAV